MQEVHLALCLNYILCAHSLYILPEVHSDLCLNYILCVYIHLYPSYCGFLVIGTYAICVSLVVHCHLARLVRIAPLVL